MNIYPKSATDLLSEANFAFLEVGRHDHVMTIRLDRERRKNALHPHMLNEIAFAMQHAHYEPSIWMVVIEAKGKVFCAGGDLKAMAGIVEPHDSTVPEPADVVLFNDIFSKVHKPVIAKITGDVYAGGFMFLAGANIVIAADDIRLALPEVKRGIYPMQVMASLLQVMSPRKVIDWCIRGYDLSVQKAEAFGLVTEVVSRSEVDQRVTEIIAELKENSPTAIKLGLEAYHHIRPSQSEHNYLLEMLGKAIMSKDGQEGLKAFREKRLPIWNGQ